MHGLWEGQVMNAREDKSTQCRNLSKFKDEHKTQKWAVMYWADPFWANVQGLNTCLMCIE